MPERLLAEFPPTTTARWKEEILADLKGADYNRLVWESDDGITVQPFYREEDMAGLAHLGPAPGEFPYVRGTRASNAWRIREVIDEPDPARANERARKALAEGAEAIAFQAPPATADDVRALIRDLNCPVHFEGGLPALRAIVETAAGVEGSLGYDPHMDGVAPGDGDEIAELVKRAARNAPLFRPVTVKAHRLHDAGATTVQELGYAITAGIDYLDGFTARSLTVDQAARALVFSFAAGSNFFFEIAKLRAARLLWAHAVEAFGPKDRDSAKALVHVRGSRFNKTVYDPYVNILRATTETISGAIGGCDSMETVPFDEPYRSPDDFSRRLARNTQLILKEESWFDRSVDPAGGAWYVEALTGSIAREAWKLIQQVENAGGFHTAWQNGTIRDEIARSRAAKQAAIASRRRTLVGTNRYANSEERMLGRIERNISPRAAEVFERIRLRTERHAEKTGRAPLFLLAEMGDLKMRKARSGFAADFFACAGFATRAEYFADAATLQAALAGGGIDAVVLCSADDEYAALVPIAVAAAQAPSPARTVAGESARPTGVPVIVAGNPKNAAELRNAGAADFIHLKTNAAETLSAWQARLGMEE
jgi:methylmalonyl-CoA mutase